VQIVPGADAVFTPPYAYTPDPASAVPNLVTNMAGAGKGPFDPQLEK
jgi:pectate lyase